MITFSPFHNNNTPLIYTVDPTKITCQGTGNLASRIKILKRIKIIQFFYVQLTYTKANKVTYNIKYTFIYACT